MYAYFGAHDDKAGGEKGQKWLKSCQSSYELDQRWQIWSIDNMSDSGDVVKTFNSISIKSNHFGGERGQERW